MTAKFPFEIQHDAKDCGPACLRIISKYYGKPITNQYLQDISKMTKLGISLMDLSDAAEAIGFRVMPVKVPLEKLLKDKPFPAIVHWRKNHFIVVYKANARKIYVADPAVGLLSYRKDEFLKMWADGDTGGYALLLEPTPKFHAFEEYNTGKINISYFLSFLLPYKKLIGQLIFGLIGGLLITTTLPFLTRSIVDIGVQQSNLNLISLILIAQLLLFGGSTIVTALRSRILLYMSTRVNISIISDFLNKLMKLPIEYFDRKHMGDILQRIGDHDRIRTFLTTGSLETIFSFFNILVFGVILIYFNFFTFSIYLLGSILYVIWVMLFLKRRKVIDYKKFQERAEVQSNQVQLVQGMQEIKLNLAERKKKLEWEEIQSRLFKLNLSSLNLEQYQSIGGSSINEIKNIFIIYYASTQVISGEMTLGMMLAISQIIGQLNSPLQQLIRFIQQAQDARISIDRLSEVHNKKEEDEKSKPVLRDKVLDDIRVEGLNFRYGGSSSPWILRDINLVIPNGKTTAIVGTSGSGKTTMLKLLLKFYDPVEGNLWIGDRNLNAISNKEWRTKIGVVMQDGFLFSDTVLNNITISDDSPDYTMFEKAIEIANIKELIQDLPLREDTKIGADGIGLSQGEKQRLMIARAIYRNPEFMFLDEATSSLDSSNEKDISNKLEKFNSNRTTVIIAHRLSTVKRADQIVVLEKGRMVELGTHAQLVESRGKYFELVRNQLELE